MNHVLTTSQNNIIFLLPRLLLELLPRLTLGLPFGLLLSVFIAGCSAAPPPTQIVELPASVVFTPTFPLETLTETPTSVPTPTATLPPTLEQLCGRLDASWSRDWYTVIYTLQQVKALGAQCGGKDPTQMLYPAYFNQGVWLSARGSREEAITAYRNALIVRPDGREAALALQKMSAFTPVPLTSCDPAYVADVLLGLPLYNPVMSPPFVRLQDGKFVIRDETYRVRGVNYYPSRAPWRRFLTDTSLIATGQELDLIRDLGLNTIRIFVRYESLFECPGSGVVPIHAAFARLDAVIRLAAERNLRLIVTLNDLPDLTIRPLYTFPAVAQMYTAFVVNRYRNEAAILAWDLRNEGDIDYTREGQSSVAVLRWLRETSKAVRRLDPDHLITAGWLSNPLVTESAVDFLSFHHWHSSSELQKRIATVRSKSALPVLIEEVGYSSYGGQEARQTTSLSSVLPMADKEQTLGWLVWVAFDYPLDVTCIPPACPSKDNGEHHYGLWRTDYTPKPVVAWLKMYLENTP